MDDLITANEVIDRLEKLIGAAFDHQKDFARANMISESYLSDVLNGRREPGPRILAALGLEKVVLYRGKQEPITIKEELDRR
jgi:transcriptional regulator with XRE-family HTH domain